MLGLMILLQILISSSSSPISSRSMTHWWNGMYVKPSSSSSSSSYASWGLIGVSWSCSSSASSFFFMGVLAFHDHAQHHHLSSSWVFLGFHDHPHHRHLLHGFIKVSWPCSSWPSSSSSWLYLGLMTTLIILIFFLISSIWLSWSY